MQTLSEFWLFRDGGKFQDSWYCFLVDETNKHDGAVGVGVTYQEGGPYGFNDRMGIEEARGLHKNLRKNKYLPADPSKYAVLRGGMTMDELLRQYKIIDNAK